MADQPLSPLTFVQTADEFPPASFPTVFADGVSNLTPGPGVVKFYFTRTDAGFQSLVKFITHPFAQVIMPTVPFVQMAIFFERSVAALVSRGKITQAEVDEIRKRESEVNQDA